MRVVQILSRRTKNNPCLIGEPGVGKTAVVEGLAERIVAEGLSVRTTEEIVRLGKAKATPRPRARQQRPLSALGESVVSALSDAYDTRVTITEGRKKGRIVIEFAGSEDLQRIADLILH